ncbi:hypothetical protein N8I74_04040 [Chitiniphilus purpureus]|uniref:ATP-binding protein n=1 Tax=Chitiniphilus purpureus TaxID=2981137 RepID=A0ABY6DPA9_9NEIS|nr:antiviral RADAR system adenosine triphosphatase RdrA [Chitiniphilus sp. CD1]UXY16200.1 hypothetical protein N8I74_04040 [Chitiniphilus sp. CD1]
MNQNKRYIPLNASESAVLRDANTLLPRDEVYEPLEEMINEALEKAKIAQDKALNGLREHNAISIDGARGTGKTAVLVNLKSYLKDRDALKDVHILDPVDPTLLEDGESLFLHIIVAAILHDKDVKEAQRTTPNKAIYLNQTLDKLAQSLESVETQENHHGMDKVRAMYSNKQLADCVQDFFREVLSLLEKKLLILPIDDVDTALNRAFENLEIVRRYLATPYVLPIVCGDRALYDEVTWRDFHGRLIKDSSYRRNEAYESAVELASEYQRKILPFPRRLTMPEVRKYWQQSNIYLRDGQNAEVMPLRNFIAWLEIFLSGPVNGLGNSQLPLPIPSIRALTQLLNQCQKLIPTLPKSIKEADSALQAKRAWQMPDVPEKAIEEFEKEYQIQHKAEKREYGPAYAKFAEYLKASLPAYATEDWIESNRSAWISSLEKHFKFEPTGGVAYLVLLARQYWQQWRGTLASQRTGSLFDTPLFQPRAHGHANYQHFEKYHDLTNWSDSLGDRLPKMWFRDLFEIKTILPYPQAEIGCSVSQSFNNQLASSRKHNNQALKGELRKLARGVDSDEKLPGKAGLLLNLLAEYYFYQSAQRAVVLNIGRIFELIIASLLGNVELSDLQRILLAAPFFSAKDLAQDIVVSAQNDPADEESGGPDENVDEDKETPLDSALIALQLEIKQWREGYEIDQLDISPWLVYKVFEKVYAMISDNKTHQNGLNYLTIALNKAGLVFYATWSAFGSFEKGRLFGLPELVTDVGLRSSRNFKQNDHFKMNIGHLAPYKQRVAGRTDVEDHRALFGRKTRTIANALAYHPLRNLVDDVCNTYLSRKRPDSMSGAQSKKGKKKSANKWLSDKLNINFGGKEGDIEKVKKAIRAMPESKCKEIWEEMSKEYKRNSAAKVALNKALELEEKFPGLTGFSDAPAHPD